MAGEVVNLQHKAFLDLRTINRSGSFSGTQTQHSFITKNVLK